MNLYSGKIISIVTSGSLSLVKLENSSIEIHAIVLETPSTSSYLVVGKEIQFMFKETEVIISKNNPVDLSLQNRILGTLESVKKGDLLSQLTLRTELGTVTSVITTNAVNQLNLSKNELIYALIKTNEIMLQEP